MHWRRGLLAEPVCILIRNIGSVALTAESQVVLVLPGKAAVAAAGVPVVRALTVNVS